MSCLSEYAPAMIHRAHHTIPSPRTPSRALSIGRATFYNDVWQASAITPQLKWQLVNPAPGWTPRHSFGYAIMPPTLPVVGQGVLLCGGETAEGGAVALDNFCWWLAGNDATLEWTALPGTFSPQVLGVLCERLTVVPVLTCCCLSCLYK